MWFNLQICLSIERCLLNVMYFFENFLERLNMIFSWFLPVSTENWFPPDTTMGLCIYRNTLLMEGGRLVWSTNMLTTLHCSKFNARKFTRPSNKKHEGSTDKIMKNKRTSDSFDRLRASTMLSISLSIRKQWSLWTYIYIMIPIHKLKILKVTLSFWVVHKN